jgi:hypothetical protein
MKRNSSIGIRVALAAAVLALLSAPARAADSTKPGGAIMAPPAPAKLFIKDVSVQSPQCGKPIEFVVTIGNSGGPFTKAAWVFIKGAGNQISHSFNSVPANGTYVDHQASAALSADCCKQQGYSVMITANGNGTGKVPEWDGGTYQVFLKPNCSLDVLKLPAAIAK